MGRAAALAKTKPGRPRRGRADPAARRVAQANMAIAANAGALIGVLVWAALDVKAILMPLSILHC